jgi:DDE superfamily endonuclease
VAEIAHLHPLRNDYLLLFVDAFSEHVQYRALNTLRDAQVHVVAFPAHTSHRTQPFGVSIFGPMKNAFQSLFARRAIATTQREARNDIYTFCEMVRDAYYKSITFSNIVAGFRSTGIWCPDNRAPNLRAIETEDFTSSSVAREVLEHAEGTGKPSFEVYCYLVTFFSRSRGHFVSAEAVMESGRLLVSTRTKGTLKSDSVTAALLEREERHKENCREKEDGSREMRRGGL